MVILRSGEYGRDDEHHNDGHQASIGNGALTVYYDGSCPLCSKEIAHYRRLNRAGRLVFTDVSSAEVALEPHLDRYALMSRFHVRHADGTMLSGAAAFASVWSVLPIWRWLGYAAALPGATSVLEVLYRLILPLRPAISRLRSTVQWHHGDGQMSENAVPSPFRRPKCCDENPIEKGANP